MIKISIVIPFYNESGNIIRLLQDLLYFTKNPKKCSINIIIVDDASTDGSGFEVEKFISENMSSPITLIRHQKNLGKTAAIESAIKIIDSDYVIFMDGDYQDDPKDVSIFIEKIQLGFDVVIGIQNKKPKFLKKISAFFYKKLLKLFLNINADTPSPQFFAIKFQYIRDLKLKKNDHRYIVIISLYNKAKFIEVDVNYHERVYGKSKFSDLKIFGAFFETINLINRLKNKKLN
jgi:glycosyltransferase involved in cell wall biosynthesis